MFVNELISLRSPKRADERVPRFESCNGITLSPGKREDDIIIVAG